LSEQPKRIPPRVDRKDFKQSEISSWCLVEDLLPIRKDEKRV
jgi:hypothetical protein